MCGVLVKMHILVIQIYHGHCLTMTSTETLFFLMDKCSFILFILSSVKALVINCLLVIPEAPVLPQAFLMFVELKDLPIHLFANDNSNLGKHDSLIMSVHFTICLFLTLFNITFLTVNTFQMYTVGGKKKLSDFSFQYLASCLIF